LDQIAATNKVANPPKTTAGTVPIERGSAGIVTFVIIIATRVSSIQCSGATQWGSVPHVILCQE
jgi:hypothetical protein